MMYCKRIVILLGMAVGFGLAGSTLAAAVTQSPGADDAVKQNFPKELLTQETVGAYESGSSYAFAVVDLDGSGRGEYVVAAYSDFISGAVRVLKKVGGGFDVVSAPRFPYMGGIYPDVKALDVDGDGRQEAVVAFSTNGAGAITWVLKWDGTTLRSIGPVDMDDHGELLSEINGPEFVDFDGTGKLNIIAPDAGAPLGEHNVPQWRAVYTLSEGIYQQSGTLNTFVSFSRLTGEPVEQYEHFSVPASEQGGAGYVMTIVNGAMDSGAVSSAIVTLNGSVVATHAQFKQKMKVLKLPVQVKAVNTLGVTLYGAPGSTLSVGVGPR